MAVSTRAVVGLFGVERLHLADGIGQAGTGLVIAIEGADLIVVGARQLILRVDYFEVVGDAGLKTVARLGDFLMGQLDPQVGDGDFAAGGFHLDRGGFHFQGDAVAQVLFPLLELADGKIGLGAVGLNSAAGEERENHTAFILVGRYGAVGSEALLHPKAAERYFRQTLVGGGASVEPGALLFGAEGTQFGPRGIGFFQGLVEGNGGDIEETDLIGDFDSAAGIEIEQPREAIERGFELGARHDEALLFVLQLDVATQRVDAGPDPVFLEVGGLIVDGLGEIDARFSAWLPPSFSKGSAKVARLFPDYEAVERDWFRRTRIFPIMHTVVIRRDLYEENRWVARSLMQAFNAAKADAVNHYRTAETFFGAPYMVPWLPALIEANRALMGSDPWAYGLEGNRKTLETYLRYHAEQGLSKRRWAVEDLFAPECLE